MDLISSLLLVSFVSLLAAISPGPDFFVVLRNSLVYSRKIGFFTSLGIALALIVHLSYTLIGIGVLISEESLFYYILKYAGAGYLFYIGIKGLLSSFKKPTALELVNASGSLQISTATALKQGFLTNLLNPKAALFFISLFSQFITTNTPISVRITYAFINWTVTLGWFLFLSYLITGKLLISRIDRFRTLIDRIMGIVLIFISLQLFFL